MWTVNFQMVKLVLEKSEEPEINLPTCDRSWKKQESSRKTSISALLTMPKQGEMDANKSSKAMWNTGIEMLQDNMTKKEQKKQFNSIEI